MFYRKKSQIFLSKRRQFNQECFEGTAAITVSEDRKQFPRLCRKLDNFSNASKSYWCQHLGDMISYSLIFFVCLVVLLQFSTFEVVFPILEESNAARCFGQPPCSANPNQSSANPSDNLLLHRYLSGFSACCTPFVERESLILRKIKKLSGNNANKSPMRWKTPSHFWDRA